MALTKGSETARNGMTPHSPPFIGRLTSGRAAVAKERVERALNASADCRLCIHCCGVDRLRGPAGACRAGVIPLAFSAQIEAGDELELLPTYAVALSGCNMRCNFCITGRESWNAAEGSSIDTRMLAARVSQAVRTGAVKTVQILGGEPTLYPVWLLEFVSHLPDHTQLVLKTNGIASDETRELLAGLFNVWLVDLKFGNVACARALSRTSGYCEAVQETIQWAATDAEIIIRHLLLPGHLECCWRPIAAWISDNQPAAKVSLRFGYWPSWKALNTRELSRVISSEEQEQALCIANYHSLNLIP